MPPVESGERPAKRRKQSNFQPVQDSLVVLYKNGDDIQKALTSQNVEIIKSSLLNLRNQFTVHGHELPISSTDGRLLLAQDWLTKSPGAWEVFEIWDDSIQQNKAFDSPVIALLASLISLLSQHYIYHTLGDVVIQKVTEATYMRKLNSNLGGNQADLILVTLKLFNALVEYADGREKRIVMDSFNWGSKSLPKLLNMRRKNQQSKGTQDSFSKADIRTLYISFMLSFLSISVPTPLKNTLLEDHRDSFLLIFKGIHQDPYDVVRRILEVCWEGVWCDGRIKRTAKIRIFTEATLLQLTKLYARSESEGEEASDIPADVVHHFLIAITSRRGTGLCFKDKGWYPPQGEDEKDDVDTKQRVGRVHNRVLALFLKNLKVSEDSRQQELALKILEACPELVQGYWSTAGFALEPRLSSRWITNIAYFGSIISLPIPTYCFTALSTSSTVLYNPTPPPLPAILESVLPSIFSKSFITKGLQVNSGPLVRHCTSLALVKCLDKFESVRRAFIQIEEALEEDAESGQWARRRAELEKEVRKRVPDFQVVVALSQQTAVPSTSSVTGQHGAVPQTEPVPNLLLSEAALRLMWLYHRSLPSLAREARFDPGKLLLSLITESSGADELALETLGQLHVIRLLQESDQFSWSTKIASTPHSYLYHLLRLYTFTNTSSIYSAAASLVSSLLSRSVLFQHDPSEVDLWLRAIPNTRRSPNARSPDDDVLVDERETVINFLDDCVQRCLKTPYRYLEETLKLMFSEQGASGREGSNRPAIAPSPLLMTVLEQYTAKTAQNLLLPSEALAIFSFLRRFVLSLVGKQPDLVFTERIVRRVDDLLGVPTPCSKSSTLDAALSRERRLLIAGLAVYQRTSVVPYPQGTRNAAIDDFLLSVEGTSIDDSSGHNASELIDWVRLIDQPLLPEDILRLIRVLKRWSCGPLLLREFFFYLDPAQNSLSPLLSEVGNAGFESSAYVLIHSERSEISLREMGQNRMPFDVAFSLAKDEELQEENVTSALLDFIFMIPSTPEIIRAVRRIIQRVAKLKTSETISGTLMLLTEVFKRAKSRPDSSILKSMIFRESSEFRGLLINVQSASTTLNALVNESLDPLVEVDLSLAADYCLHWAAQLRQNSDSPTMSSVLPAAQIWIPYMPDQSLLTSFDAVMTFVESSQLDVQAISTSFLTEVVKTLKRSTSAEVVHHLRGQLPRLWNFSRSSKELEGDTIQELLASLLDAHFPTAFDGQLVTPPGIHRLSALCSQSIQRWNRRLERAALPLTLSSVLSEPLTTATSRLATTLIYGSPLGIFEFSEWMSSNKLKLSLSPLFLPIIHAFLDSCIGRSDMLPQLKSGLQVALLLLPSLLDSVVAQSSTSVVAEQATSSIVSLYLLHSTARREFQSTVVDKLQSASPRSVFRTRVQILIYRLAQADAQNGLRELIDSFVDRGLQWVVRRFSEDSTDSSNFEVALGVFSRILSTTPEVKPHLAEPVLNAGIQNRLSSVPVVLFLHNLVSTTSLKPVVSNRLIQNIVQHNHFVPGARDFVRREHLSASLRETIIGLLRVLFFMHPLNSCQPSHVIPLVQIYGGTLARADRQILSIFRLFEQYKGVSVLSVMKRWTAVIGGPAGSKFLDTLTSLDPGVVMRTCSSFPSLADMEPRESSEDPEPADIYDPILILSLLGATLTDGAVPLTGFDWVTLLRTNTVGVAICSLSSKSSNVRDLASQTLLALWNSLQDATFQERDQVLYTLSILRAMFHPRPDASTSTQRLPTYSMLLLAHALRCIFYPSNFMYPLISRFLLQRPELDKGDVPMLFGLLYSSSEGWRRERAWMVRFLSDGMRSSQDWRILKRRHTWDLLATLFQSLDSDPSLRSGILDVLSKATSNVRANASLVLHSSLLSWIEIQLLDARESEADRWLHILEHVVFNVDHEKVERATLGSWRRSILNSLKVISQLQGGSLERLFRVGRVIARLSASAQESAQVLTPLITEVLKWLDKVEETISFSEAAIHDVMMFCHRNPDPKAYHKYVSNAPDLWTWGRFVETLWEAIMRLDNDKGSAGTQWAALTSRLLVWNSISRQSVQGEWARRETLSNLLAP